MNIDRMHIGDSSNIATKAAIQLATEHTFHFFNSHF